MAIYGIPPSVFALRRIRPRNPLGIPVWTLDGCGWHHTTRVADQALPVGTAVGLADVEGWAPIYVVYGWWHRAVGGSPVPEPSLYLSCAYDGREVMVAPWDPDDLGKVRRVDYGIGDERFPAMAAGMRSVHLSHDCGVARSSLHTSTCTHELDAGLFDLPA